MEIDIRALEESVILFYRSTETTQQAAAHEWLTQAQCSPQAWRFAWELMQPGKQCEVQFFGATTLHSKLMKYWHEVPQEIHNELKQKLLETIITFGSGPKLVLDRLCIALSAFVVHMITQEWPTAIEDIVNSFQNQQLPNFTTNTQIWIMMEVLCAIPEEANAIYSSVARVNLRNEINKRTEFVVNVINQYISVKCEENLTTDDMNTVLRAVKCAKSWFKNGGLPLDSCQYISNSLLKLINKCYWHSTENDGCMSAEASELADLCLDTLLVIMIQPDANRYSATALNLMKMFLDSLSEITKAEWKENNLNEDIAVGIYNLFISSIECHSRLLLSGLSSQESTMHKELYVRLIHEILQCTDKPGIYPVEESCSILSLGFWYMLQNEIFSMDDHAQRSSYTEMIKPLYSHLTKILVKKSQQPNEQSLERWNSSDLEAFRCYRQDISDTLIYCYEVLGDEILNIFHSLLEESLQLLHTDASQWPKLEACVYSFYAIAAHVESIEHSQCIPKFIQILAEIPYKKLNSIVLGTALETIGAYSEWLKENPNYLPLAIDLLVQGLNSPNSSQATLGLKDLTRECQKEMKNYAEPLLDACQQLLVGGQLKSTESVRLMFSIGKLMSMLPPDKITICLDSMVSPCFKEIYMICESRSTNDSSKSRIIFNLNMISTLFSSLNTNDVNDDENSDRQSNEVQQPTMDDDSGGGRGSGDKRIQPVLVVMQKTMSIFKEICDIWINDDKVIESLCSALKYAILNLMNDFTPMLPNITLLILNIFNNRCTTSAIEISRICILTFYRDLPYKQTMQELLFGMTEAIFKLFERTPEEHFSKVADLLESYYMLNSQIVKKIPIAYTETNIDCRKLIGYALKGLTLPENGPIKYGAQFLSHFILQSRPFPNMTSTILEMGEQIVKTSLMCIGNLTPRSQVDYFADIFLSINKKYPQEIIVWLKILETPNFPTQHIDASDKESFMKTIIRERVNKRLIQGNIREFSVKCRGLVEKI